MRNTMLALALTSELLTACARSHAPGGANAGPATAPTAPALAPAAPAPAAPALAPAAVLELFTSEGCSSCPPADETLAAITDEAEHSGRRVFTLELHVDYWNQLGWVDPFSSERYSERQGAYARSLGQDGLYTPELVVNGREQMLGSDAAAAHAAIARALTEPSTVGVAVTGTRVGSESPSIRVDYRIATRSAVDVGLAVLQDEAKTSVTRGENASRTLRHRHVVRAFATRRVTQTSSGSWLAPWPVEARGQGAFVVAFATDPQSLAVLGSDGAGVPRAD